MLELIAAGGGGMIVGCIAGQRWYRWRIRRAIRQAAVEAPPVPGPQVDNDAMFRVLKAYQSGELR